MRAAEDRLFVRFCRGEDPCLLAAVFDRTAPELLRVAAPRMRLRPSPTWRPSPGVIAATFNHKDLLVPNIRSMHMILIVRGGASSPWPLRGTVLMYDEVVAPDGCAADNKTRWWILNPTMTPGAARWLSFTDYPSNPPPAMPMLVHDQGTGNLACSGHTILEDGRVLIVAGNDLHGQNGPNDYALPPPACIRGQYHAYLFDPTQGTISSDQTVVPRTWRRQTQQLFRRRWYPSVVLITGWFGTPPAFGTRAVVLGGNHEPFTFSTYEVWRPPTWPGQDGQWQQNQSSGEWQYQFPGAPTQYLGVYPYAHLLSNGQLVVVPFTGGYWDQALLPPVFHPSSPQPSTLRHDAAPGVWTTFNNDNDPTRLRYRAWGCSLPMPNRDASHSNCLVLIGGGHNAFGPPTYDMQMCKAQHAGIPVADCWPMGNWWTDLPGLPTQCNNALPALTIPRYAPNVVLLPDGSFLVIGGDGVLDITRWDNGQWNPCASLQQFSTTLAGGYGFHSTALLLPDGSVLIGAGNPWPDPQHTNTLRWDFQVYWPWYLADDVVRPTILSVNSGVEAIAYGQSFAIQHEVDPGVAIDKVVLVRPSSVTHGCNTEQRYIELEITEEGVGQVTARMPRVPGDPQMAPTEVSGTPGYYMLFLVSAARVPSVAAWVRLTP